jgi:hypothetical protein
VSCLFYSLSHCCDVTPTSRTELQTKLLNPGTCDTIHYRIPSQTHNGSITTNHPWILDVNQDRLAEVHLTLVSLASVPSPKPYPG